MIHQSNNGTNLFASIPVVGISNKNWCWLILIETLNYSLLRGSGWDIQNIKKTYFIFYVICHQWKNSQSDYNTCIMV